MTHGNNHNCKCPYCGKINHYVLDGEKVSHDRITEFTRPCQHCQKIVYYWARWEIAIDAEKESKVK